MSEQKPEGGEVIGEADIWGKDFQAGGSTSVKAQMEFAWYSKNSKGFEGGGCKTYRSKRGQRGNEKRQILEGMSAFAL